jgi:apolipoprotein N-acyltransferase
LKVFGLSLGLGALTVAGFAPLAAWPIPLLTLAALFWLNRAATPRAAFLSGTAFGLGFFLTGVSWVFISLTLFGGLPAPIAAIATFLFCAFIALFPGIALAFAAKIRSLAHANSILRMSTLHDWRVVLLAVLALPATWVLMEWVRGWIFTGFPWLAMGYSQVPDSPLAGYAPVLGVYGVSLVVALVAAMLATLRANWITLAILLLVGGHGLQQVVWTQPVGAPVTVALLQGNVPQEMKFRPEKLVSTLQDYAQQVFASDARLVVLPETAIPIFLSGVPQDYLEGLAAHMRERDGDLLLGVPEDRPGGAYFNSAITLGASPSGHYQKSHLVPFGEFVPFGFRWLVDMMHIPLGDFNRGAPDQPAIAAAGQKLAVNICYEDAFGEERIHAAREATLLVNISNDAWFGNSLSPRQHLQIGAMRSMETGRWQLRANNTGVTAVLDEKGRVRAELPLFTPATLNATAQGMTGLTPYLRWGNAPVLWLIALTLGGAVFFAMYFVPHPSSPREHHE